MIAINKTYHTDCLAGAKMLPDNFINCIVTSPPYFGLRDYGVGGQWGLEKSPEEYLSKMVLLFRELHRVLRPDGTMWIVIGDSYSRKRQGNVKQKDLLGMPWQLALALRNDG